MNTFVDAYAYRTVHLAAVDTEDLDSEEEDYWDHLLDYVDAQIVR